MPEVGLLGRGDGHVHAPLAGDLGHAHRGLDAVGYGDARIILIDVPKESTYGVLYNLAKARYLMIFTPVSNCLSSNCTRW